MFWLSEHIFLMPLKNENLNEYNISLWTQTFTLNNQLRVKLLLLIDNIYWVYFINSKMHMFLYFSIFEIVMKHNRIPLGWLFGVPLWGGNDSFVRYAQIYLSSLLLRVCIGVTEHIEFQCHVKSLQKNCTLIHS